MSSLTMGKDTVHMQVMLTQGESSPSSIYEELFELFEASFSGEMSKPIWHNLSQQPSLTVPGCLPTVTGGVQPPDITTYYRFSDNANTLVMLSLATKEAKERIHRLRKSGSSIDLTLGQDRQKAEIALQAFQLVASKGDLAELLGNVVQAAEEKFIDLKGQLKTQRASLAQLAIAQQLNEIETRTENYPLLSAKDAAKLYGDFRSTNPSRVVSNAKQANEIFAFNFGNSKNVQVPAFQFKPQLGVYAAVPKLCRILSGLNDWGVYHWFTSEAEDLGCTPADALAKPDLEGDLLYLAGLFKNDSTFRSLSFESDQYVDKMRDKEVSDNHAE